MEAPRTLPDGLLVAWYGDDYTGAAAVMEVLAFAGLPAVLFFEPPSQEQLARFPGIRGLGIAGAARARSPAWMETHLPPVFRYLADLGAPVTHYKICSTLDSAPQVGSIGKAIDLALEAQPVDWVPLLTAAPAVGRYQAFGTLFASSATGVHRLDRHPVMARHPVTPMTEADVTRHLAAQTARPIGLVALDALQDGSTADAALADARRAGAEIVALDVVDDRTEAASGRLIWEQGGPRVLVAGSQGVEYALIRHWCEAGLLVPPEPPPHPAPVAHLPVVSGSASPTTDAQIGWAAEHGFAPIRFDPCAILGSAHERDAAIASLVDSALAAGGDPLVHTARGPEDPAIARFREAADAAGIPPEAANAAIGEALGDILGGILARTGWRRAVIAGGDTSSLGAARLGIMALTARAATVPGGALCDAHFRESHHPPLEIALKGGQMGGPDFFGMMRDGLQ
jgi:uncharacterized protein YgbK (DUF1537 family)